MYVFKNKMNWYLIQRSNKKSDMIGKQKLNIKENDRKRKHPVKSNDDINRSEIIEKMEIKEIDRIRQKKWM